MTKDTELASQLMDSEAVDAQAVNDLMRDQSQHDSWNSFHLIRDLMQGKTADFVAPDLHLRIAEAIAEEPTLMVPAARREVNSWRRRISEWGEQLTSYAIAASVTTFILYSVQQIQTPTPETPSAITTLELIVPSDYQIANQTSAFQESLLDFSRMSTIYGGQHMNRYVQGVNYSVAIPLQAITEKRVLELESESDQKEPSDSNAKSTPDPQ